MAILAIQNPIFQPAMRIINTIIPDPTSSNSRFIVETTFDHNYFVGDIVRIFIPIEYGMQQLDKFEGNIVAITATTFTLEGDINSFDPFAYPVTPQQYPQVIAVGEITSTLLGATRNVLRDGHR